MNDTTTTSSTRASLLARAAEYGQTEPSFGRFIRQTVEATDPEDLSAVSAQAFEVRLRQSYARLGQRKDATFNVYITKAREDGDPEIVEVFSADMPFIVDSVMAALRARGAVVRLMSHPILPFDPETYRVVDGSATGSRRESFLHAEIDPLLDDDQRDALRDELERTMTDVAHAVAGWRAMLLRIRRAVEEWHVHPPEAPPAAVAEAQHFLNWLADDNFTFLGMREYRLEGAGAGATLTPVATSGLGILADPDVLFLRAGAKWVEMTPQHAVFLAEPAPLLAVKANIRSRVHRRAHIDYIGVKLYDEKGRISGELRILGLFTSSSYATPNAEVPLIRRKVAEVMRRSGHDPHSHAGKTLQSVLENYSREELFQIEEDQLHEFATLIAALQDRPHVRVLSRVDRFDNFVSVLVFVPRDRYDTDARIRIGAYLAKVYQGRVSTFYPNFPEGDLVRVHFIIGRDGGITPRPPRGELEAAVADLIKTFGDRLLQTTPDPRAITGWLHAFSPAYVSQNSAADALYDIETIRLLPDERAIAMRLGSRQGEAPLGLKVYHRGSPIPLSDRVPMLENFGFRVVDERTYTIRPEGEGPSFIHDMLLDLPGGLDTEDRDNAQRIENAILAVWGGDAENDGLNQLTSIAGLSWFDVEVLRAMTRYLPQVGIPYSRSYLISVLVRHPDVATALTVLFHTENDPHFAAQRQRSAQIARDTINAAIEATTSLDEDRILRRYLNLCEAVVRTNAYQRDESGARRPALALKFDCGKVDGLPEPKPFREIFVYSPRVEGLHLRFGPIARGGLRWSDRPEDFRTEVLGLVKAQQVKNAIIVPVGAKGAFVPRRMPDGADRDTVLKEGTACYKIFVSSLLDVTDNLDGDTIVPPPDVLTRDAPDPYLVVAADKGTASFSDTANAIALARDYWLGDAFASGGSAGYDHKEMGITARGGWESVKRHFREIGRDIQAVPFTAVGVGDMSGDVFGNGMLLSPQMRLIAAFDHRDVFVDPDPDPGRSLAERQRLFALPRSSWQDYDRSVISEGGGVFSRTLKSVPLSDQARAALGLGGQALTPAEVIRAILKAKVDLLWFGGIGTYVRSSDETDAEVGDKANDALRIGGAEISALVVGEGANLGVTQLGRVEYARKGGRINTDAIDNSAGVNSSDLEVNIKIALGAVMRSGELSLEARNEFLASMTDQVAALCLRNNYLQTLAISVEQHRGLAAFPEHLGLIGLLEDRGELHRSVEFLPADAELRQRAVGGQALTRPELAVLLAYAKNSVYADLVRSSVTSDPYLGRELYRYFPDLLTETWHDAVANHRLRREVIATVLANAMINRGGPAFVSELMQATSADAGLIATAYAAARDVFGLTELNRLADGLDNLVSGDTQLGVYQSIQALLKRATLWFLRNGRFDAGLSPLVTRYGEGVAEIRRNFGTLLTPSLEAIMRRHRDGLIAAGLSGDLAGRFAELPILSMAADVVLVAERADVPVGEAAPAFFGVLETFRLGDVVEEGNRIVLADRFDRMALDRSLANLNRAQRDLTADVLAARGDTVAERIAAWRTEHADAVDRLIEAVRGLTEGGLTVSRLSVAAGLLSDLARSA